ncbi:MAG: hypothetical protein PF542_02055 [Nanoarchaeota archaeon]|jgi:hypothetical protein|nr:hypothetical protein [Nanoarchaeota archaeon]
MIKVGNLIIIIMFALLLITTSAMFYQEYSKEDIALKDKIEDRVLSMAHSEQNLLTNYIKEKENQALFVSSLDGAKDVLLQKPIVKEELARESVRNSMGVLKKEVENYMIFNKDKTLDELLQDSTLIDIVLRNTDTEHYNFLYQLEGNQIIIHPEDVYVGQEFKEILEIAPEFIALAENISAGERYLEGEYKFIDSNGETHNKFAAIELISIKTSDGKVLVLVSTVNLDNYMVYESIPTILENRFSDLIEVSQFSNVMIISSEGRVFYDYGKTDIEGVSLNQNFEEHIDIINLLGKKEVSIIGPVPLIGKSKSYVFLIFVPIIKNGEYLGFFLYEYPAESVYDLLAMKHKSDIDWSSFLVNSYYLLASPIGEDKSDVLVQDISYANVEKCFAEKVSNFYAKYEGTEGYHQAASKYLNYAGDSVLGVGLSINDNLCLVLEADYKNTFVKELNKKDILDFLSIIAPLIFVIPYLLFTRKYLNRKYKLVLNKKSRKSFEFKPLCDCTLPNMIIISFVTAAIIFVGITSFYGAWNNTITFHENIFDALLIGLGISFVILSFKIAPLKEKLFVLLGAVSFVGIKILEIFAQLIYISNNVNFPEWLTLVVYFRYISLVLIFEGYRRLVK